MKKAAVGLLLIMTGIMVFLPAEAGHEMAYYPSFYPQEIRLEVLPPAVAASRLHSNTLHAYLDGAALFGDSMPANVSLMTSLGAYLVVTFNSASARLSQKENRCAVAQEMLATLVGKGGIYVFHPYPVTPYHWDYLHHFDRAMASKTQYLQHPTPRQSVADLRVKVQAQGELVELLLQAGWQIREAPWDALIEEVDISALLTSHTSSLSSWFGPPWLKEGWFHAYLLLADTVSDQAVQAAVQVMAQRLQHGRFDTLEEKLNVERELVTLLLHGCERLVIGYTVRRDYFNTDYSAGIENIAYDSHTGFNSPIFLRTVKLKDLPWNGWLRLGLRTPPAAAWNPIAGFSDATGRLLWDAVGDFALFPAPYSGSWTLNRIADYESTMRPLELTTPAQGLVQP